MPGAPEVDASVMEAVIDDMAGGPTFADQEAAAEGVAELIAEARQHLGLGDERPWRMERIRSARNSKDSI